MCPVLTTRDASDLLNLGSETSSTRRPLSSVKRRKVAVSVGAWTRGGRSAAAEMNAATRRAAAATSRFMGGVLMGGAPIFSDFHGPLPLQHIDTSRRIIRG